MIARERERETNEEISLNLKVYQKPLNHYEELEFSIARWLFKNHYLSDITILVAMKDLFYFLLYFISKSTTFCFLLAFEASYYSSKASRIALCIVKDGSLSMLDIINWAHRMWIVVGVYLTIFHPFDPFRGSWRFSKSDKQQQ